MASEMKEQRSEKGGANIGRRSVLWTIIVPNRFDPCLVDSGIQNAASTAGEVG